MAVIAPAIKDLSPFGDQSCMQVIWTPVTENDSCGPVQYPKHSTKSIQVETSGVGNNSFGGCSVALKGSNDGTNFEALSTPANAAIAITAAGIKAVLENTVQIKPVATGGTNQSIAITMLLEFANPTRQ